MSGPIARGGAGSVEPARLDDGEPGDLAEVILRWTVGICGVPTMSVDTVAGLLRLDLERARRIGRQRVFAQPDALVQLVLGADGENVLFVTLRPARRLTASDLTAVFGQGHLAAPDPHRCTPTVFFEVVPPDSARGCVVLARGAANAVAPEPDAIDEVVIQPA